MRRRPDHGGHDEHRGDRQHQHVVADLRDDRRVVHRAVHRVADAGIGEARQRPVQHPPEDQAAQRVVDAVRDAQLVAVLEQPEQAAHAAAGHVGLVLALGGGVHAFRQLPVGAVSGHAASERARQNHAEQAHGNDHQRDLQRRQAVQQFHEPRDVGRIRRWRRSHRQPHHHMVDEHLQRPRQEQHDGQASDGERQLHADLPPMRPHETQCPSEQRKRLAAGDALLCACHVSCPKPVRQRAPSRSRFRLKRSVDRRRLPAPSVPRGRRSPQFARRAARPRGRLGGRWKGGG